MTEGKFTLPRGFVTDVRAAVAGKVRMDDVAPKFYREYLAARAHKMTMLQYFRVFDSTLPESITRMTLPKIQKQFPNYNHLRYLLRRGQNLAMVPNLVNKRKGAEKAHNTVVSIAKIVVQHGLSSDVVAALLRAIGRSDKMIRAVNDEASRLVIQMKQANLATSARSPVKQEKTVSASV